MPGGGALRDDHLLLEAVDQRAHQADVDRRDERDPVRGQPRGQQRHRYHDRVAAAHDGRGARDHVAVGEHVGAAELDLGRRLRQLGQGGQRARDVGDRNGLGARVQPARRDHHRQPARQVAQHLERGAAGADDHRRAHVDEPGHALAQQLRDLVARAQVLGGRVVAEPAEIDHALDAGVARRPRRSSRPPRGRGARNRRRRRLRCPSSGSGSRRCGSLRAPRPARCRRRRRPCARRPSPAAVPGAGSRISARTLPSLFAAARRAGASRRSRTLRSAGSDPNTHALVLPEARPSLRLGQPVDGALDEPAADLEADLRQLARRYGPLSSRARRRSGGRAGGRLVARAAGSHSGRALAHGARTRLARARGRHACGGRRHVANGGGSAAPAALWAALVGSNVRGATGLRGFAAARRPVPAADEVWAAACSCALRPRGALGGLAGGACGGLALGGLRRGGALRGRGAAGGLRSRRGRLAGCPEAAACPAAGASKVFGALTRRVPIRSGRVDGKRSEHALLVPLGLRLRLLGLVHLVSHTPASVRFPTRTRRTPAEHSGTR